jgi:hypothetical protein
LGTVLEYVTSAYQFPDPTPLRLEDESAAKYRMRKVAEKSIVAIQPAAAITAPRRYPAN